MPDLIPDGFLHRILSLIHDPQFIAFETQQNPPSIFNAVGRTYTETWHSAAVRVVTQPEKQPMGLGTFPLSRFLLLLGVVETLLPSVRGVRTDALAHAGRYLGSACPP